jgi:hypothetical protein
VYKQHDFHQGFDTELENLIGGGKVSAQADGLHDNGVAAA